jgi:hypothetical protein
MGILFALKHKMRGKVVARAQNVTKYFVQGMGRAQALRGRLRRRAGFGGKSAERGLKSGERSEKTVRRG